MFPLHSGDELFFDVSSDSSHQLYTIPQDPISGHAAASASASPNLVDAISTDEMGKSGRQKSSSSRDTDKIPFTINNNNKKKLIHRDIERQRRQEMATLYASLRALLPLETLKGKRSISDQMSVAVNYIKYLEKKKKDLGVRRDELKKLSNLSTSTNTTPSASQIGSRSDQSCHQSGNCFVVQPSLVGIEVAYGCCGCLEQELVPLSKVLEVLLDEGLCVVNCVSTRVDEKLLHTIHAEVKDQAEFDLRELQQKLTQVK